MAVDGPEVAALVGPFVPDAHAVLVEVFDIGVAGQEPEQFVHDRLQVQLLGGEHRKALVERKAHLMAEHRARAGAGAVVLFRAVVENMPHQIEILAHRLPCFPATRTSDDTRPARAEKGAPSYSFGARGRLFWPKNLPRKQGNGGLMGRIIALLAVLFVASGDAGSVISSASAAPRRVEVPIHQRVLSDGTVRYWIPVRIGNSRPIETMLDSGSIGLRILPGAISPDNYSMTDRPSTYGYGSGVRLNGNVANARVEIGGMAGEAPTAIQVVRTVDCFEKKPKCPASRIPQAAYGLGGDGLANQGFKAIIGIEMPPPGKEQPVFNPITHIGGESLDHHLAVARPIRSGKADYRSRRLGPGGLRHVHASGEGNYFRVST